MAASAVQEDLTAGWTTSWRWVPFKGVAAAGCDTRRAPEWLHGSSTGCGSAQAFSPRRREARATTIILLFCVAPLRLRLVPASVPTLEQLRNGNAEGDCQPAQGGQSGIASPASIALTSGCRVADSAASFSCDIPRASRRLRTLRARTRRNGASLSRAIGDGEAPPPPPIYLL